MGEICEAGVAAVLAHALWLFRRIVVANRVARNKLAITNLDNNGRRMIRYIFYGASLRTLAFSKTTETISVSVVIVSNELDLKASAPFYRIPSIPQGNPIQTAVFSVAMVTIQGIFCRGDHVRD